MREVLPCFDVSCYFYFIIDEFCTEINRFRITALYNDVWWFLFMRYAVTSQDGDVKYMDFFKRVQHYKRTYVFISEIFLKLPTTVLFGLGSLSFWNIESPVYVE